MIIFALCAYCCGRRQRLQCNQESPAFVQAVVHPCPHHVLLLSCCDLALCAVDYVEAGCSVNEAISVYRYDKYMNKSICNHLLKIVCVCLPCAYVFSVFAFVSVFLAPFGDRANLPFCQTFCVSTCLRSTLACAACAHRLSVITVYVPNST